MDYRAFLEAKIKLGERAGFDVDPAEINPALKPFTQEVVQWAAAGGRRAIFAAFGLHKTVTQIELMRLIGVRRPGIRLITLPLGVRQEFFRDAELHFGGEHAVRLKFIRRAGEVDDERSIYLTNYESVREGILDVAALRPVAVSLDEASILRGFGGTKTFRESMALFAGDDRRDRSQRVESAGVPFRFVATATPSPNEYIELLAYGAFLGVMDVGQAKTRFFKRNSEKADALTLHPHKIEEFWMWVSSWALFITRPSDICQCDAKNSQVSDSGSSSSKDGRTAPGAADATAAIPADLSQPISSKAVTPVADAPAPSTAEKEPAPSPSGRECSTVAGAASTRTGLNTADAASSSASAGSPSRTSSPTWESRHQEQPSSDVTTTGITRPETATGQPEKPKPETPDDPSSSLTATAPNRSPHGPKSSAPTTGSSTAATSSAGLLNGCSLTCRCNEGYQLPALDVIWHEIPSDHRAAGAEKDGQNRLFKNAAIGVTEASREKRASLAARVARLREIVAAGDGSQWVLWCDLNDEQDSIGAALQALSVSYSSLFGSQDIDEREALLAKWKARETLAFLSKPMMYGAGVNMQQAHQMVFAGIGFKFQDFLQAIHRIQRFGQEHPCKVHIIYTEAEREVRRELERKWQQHTVLVARMTEIIREFGLSNASIANMLGRTIGCERIEASGERFTLVHNDCVEETQAMPAASVGLIVTSIPFSHQYEYSPSYNDFGHTDDNAHFWRQMDFLTPQLLRVLQPGRVCAIHVKDRITPGGINGFGFQTVTRISDACADHFEKHGFAFLGRITIPIDVVRENNQTYRLGWTEQCKDGSRMGNGLPEYVMLFRKPPTDRSNGYADVPVVKSKDKYTRARWQFDAHGYWRSSGDRLLAPEDLDGLPQAAIFKLFRKYSLENVYDFERDVALAEHVDRSGWLPSTFMLLQPQSWHPDVWTDVTRMRTLNADQAAKGREMHLCPLQFDIVDRLVTRFSMESETVFDPFAGLGTVPMRAVKLGRRGLGCELNAAYWRDSIIYCRAAERGLAMPTLFDLDALEEAA